MEVHLLMSTDSCKRINWAIHTIPSHPVCDARSHEYPIPWSSHTQDEIVEDWFSSFDSLFSFYFTMIWKTLISVKQEQEFFHRHTHSRDLFGSDRDCQLSPPVNLTQMCLHRSVDFAHSTSRNLKLSKNHTKKRTFVSEVLLWQASQTLPIAFVVETLAAEFWLFSFLSLFLLATLPSCVLIWWALGKQNKK